ncbi:MAG: DUF3786 domain-containing protein [Desulfobacterales bacterium]|jgi:hypothetical protein
MAGNHPKDPTPGYAPDGSHLRPNAILWKDLEARSPEELANLTLAQPMPGGRLRFRFLSEDIVVDIPNHCLTRTCGNQDVPLEDSLIELVTLAYLNQVDAILPLDHDIVGLQDLKEAHFFVGPHELRTAKVLDRYGDDPDAFKKAVLALDGRKVDMADVAGRLLPFPRIPLYFLLWVGDEEFPARLRVLFDRSIERFMPADAIWALVNRVARSLADGVVFSA